MSIQDESFPYDDDLEFSRNSGKNYVFPHHKPRQSNVTENKEINEEKKVLDKKNISSCSALQNQDDSTQSLSDFCLPSETSGKTNASEPNDLQESKSKKSEYVRQNTSKSISYQDIHSEYTKKRYKHVESKVGQYIANMKAQDEKRRNFQIIQRHSSMPETLETTVTELNNDSKKRGILCRSSDYLHAMDNQHNGLQSDHDHDHDTDNYDNNLTATTSSLSNRDSGAENGIFLDKQTYEQLLNDKERKDYLQTKLEEKNAENWRLKKNLDTMRIEYSLCKDKLKQQTQAQRFSGSFGSINVAAAIGGAPLQSLLYPPETKDKSTQTDNIVTPSPILVQNKTINDMFATPDSNNNSFDFAAVGMLAPAAHRVSKCVATIQPLSLNFSNLVDQDFNTSSINTTMSFLRQRSNSLALRKKSTPLPANISKISPAVSSVPSSSDSAIDIEVAESPKNQRQNRPDEFIYYEQRSQRYAILGTRNAGQNNTDTKNNLSGNNTIESGTGRSNKRNCRKRHNLRSRMMKFFRACTKCRDANMSPEVLNNTQHSQIPLLEKKYTELLP